MIDPAVVVAAHGLPGVRVIVFSKDRPLQLDAALKTFAMHCLDAALAQVHVLFTASDASFAAGYRILAADHPTVEFHRQSDFKADLVGLASTSEYVFFVVDDTLFVAPFLLATAMGTLERDPTCIGFSYRLGRNTTYCYTLDQPQRLPPFEDVAPSVLTYVWGEAQHDFGYPLEVSSSLYRTADFLPLLTGLSYSNPNSLEASIAQEAGRMRPHMPKLACLQQSVAFSVPANLVQTAWINRTGARAAQSAQALARAYARGERLDVLRYDGVVSNSCHVELELHLVRDPSVPTVSIIIPCYGQAQYLEDAVTSVVAQTFEDWELIIVDDGSPDDTAIVANRLISTYRDRRIRLIRQENSGLARARNAAIELSKGRYVLPLDADDQIEPRMLEKTVGLLESRPGVAIAYTDLQQFGDGSAVIRADEFHAWGLPAENQLNYCSLYRREVWESAGGYNPNMVYGYEDWDFWLSSIESGYVAERIPEPLFHYRIRQGTMISVALAHDLELRERLRANHAALYAWHRRLRRRMQKPIRRLRRRISRSRAIHSA